MIDLRYYLAHPGRNPAWRPGRSRLNKRIWSRGRSISRWMPHQSTREMERRRRRMGK